MWLFIIWWIIKISGKTKSFKITMEFDSITNCHISPCRPKACDLNYLIKEILSELILLECSFLLYQPYLSGILFLVDVVSKWSTLGYIITAIRYWLQLQTSFLDSCLFVPYRSVNLIVIIEDIQYTFFEVTKLIIILSLFYYHIRSN